MNQLTFQSVYQTTASAQFAIGQRGMTPDGRMWVYAQNKSGATFSKGLIAIPITNVTANNCSSSADAIGRIVYVTKTGAGWDVGQFENQLMYVTSGTGIGQVAKIQTNSADTLQLYPENALTTALSAVNSNITIVQPSLVKPSAITSKVQRAVGCPQVDVPTDAFGWFLTEGDGFVIVGTSTLIVGSNFTTGDGTVPGEVIVGVTSEGPFDAQSLGICLAPNTASDTAALVRFEIRG